MALRVVSPGALPGDWLDPDTSTAQAGPAVCDLGSRDGAGEGSVSGRVQVVVRAVGSAGAPDDPTTVTPDAAGRFMHCLIVFARSRGGVLLGKFRENVAGYAPEPLPGDVGPMQVECDPDSWFFSSGAAIWTTGGTPGDVYDVTVTRSTAQQQADAAERRGEVPWEVDVYEPAFTFALTSYFSTGEGAYAPIAPPPLYHARFWLVSFAGSGARVGGIHPLTTTGRKNYVPTSASLIEVAGAGIYRTGGSV